MMTNMEIAFYKAKVAAYNTEVEEYYKSLKKVKIGFEDIIDLTSSTDCNGNIIYSVPLTLPKPPN